MSNLKRSALLAALVGSGLAFGLPACTATRPDVVPAAAIESGSGKGDVTYIAGDSGTVYVYNRTWNQLIYSGPIDRGQQVKVDTLGGRVLVNNQVVTQHTLGGDDTFSIYLDHTNMAGTRDPDWRNHRASDMP